MSSSMSSKWSESRIPALTYILTHPTTTPSLHSQLFISHHLSSSLDYYPPLFSSNHQLLIWSLSLFLRRLRRPHPLSSWRSKCPFQQPPPLVLSSAVEPAPATWGSDELRGYFRRRRVSRRRLGWRVPVVVAVAVPNLALLLGFIIWDDRFIKRTA